MGAAADDVTLEVAGPFADELSGDNLVLPAALALRDAAGVEQGAALRLTRACPSRPGSAADRRTRLRRFAC